jgi:hypothetical protein
LPITLSRSKGSQTMLPLGHRASCTWP